MKLKRKAQVEQLGTMVISLVAVAIVLGLGMIILVNVLNQSADVSPDSTCCANKSAFWNESLVKCCEYACNGTWCIATGDSHTANGTNMSLANCTGADINQEFTAACNSTVEVINATDDIPGWLSIIVIVIIGAILIGLVSMFRRR